MGRVIFISARDEPRKPLIVLSAQILLLSTAVLVVLASIILVALAGTHADDPSYAIGRVLGGAVFVELAPLITGVRLLRGKAGPASWGGAATTAVLGLMGAAAGSSPVGLLVFPLGLASTVLLAMPEARSYLRGPSGWIR